MPSTDAAHPSARYASFIHGLLRGEPKLVTSVENEDRVCVERAGVLELAWRQASLAQLLNFVEPLTRPRDDFASLAVVDRKGSPRPHYRGFLAYSWLSALRMYRGSPNDAFFAASAPAARKWCHSLFATLANADPKGSSSHLASTAWEALAVWLGGDVFEVNEWFNTGFALLMALAENQEQPGSFLGVRSSEHPETTWFYEMVILHALAALAARTGNPTVERFVQRAAEFHLNEIQPDHATTEPWGLLAFIRNPSANSLADQLLHTVQVQSPAGPTGVSRILLADTLQSLSPRG